MPYEQPSPNGPGKRPTWFPEAELVAPRRSGQRIAGASGPEGWTGVTSKTGERRTWVAVT